jgi:2'-5' RNA ligase
VDPHRGSGREGAGAAIRAFYAVELSAPARAAAAALARVLRRQPGGDAVRWVREESLHVTLRFLGNVDVERLPGLVERVREQTAQIAPFRLRLGPVRAFPSPRRPRVIALDVEPAAPVEALAAAVERGVVAADFPPEERAFRPHLTLGRVKGRAGRLLDVTAPDTAPDDAWDVTETVLFRSDLGRSGAKYTPLERAPLGAPGDDDPTHP